MIKTAKRPLSFFDKLNVGDEIDFLDGENVRMVFVKNTYDTAEVHTYRNGEKVDEFPFEYIFKEFPSGEDEFIQRVKYLILRDLAGENSSEEQVATARHLQNEDLKDTYLQLIPAPGFNLGHGIFVKNVNEPEAVRDAIEFRRSEGTNEDLLSRMSGASATDIFPQRDERSGGNAYLPDFIYSYKIKSGDRDVPFTMPIVISYQYADEIYDINSSSELKDFLVERLEERYGGPIDRVSEIARRELGLDPESESEPQTIRGYVGIKDVFEIYETKKASDKVNLKSLNKSMESLIKEMRDGEQFSAEDVNDYLDTSSHRDQESVIAVEDYRAKIEMFQIDKEINRFEIDMERHINQMEKHKGQSFEVSQGFHNSMDKVLELQEEFEASLNDRSGGIRRKEIIKEIRETIQQAKDLIKK